MSSRRLTGGLVVAALLALAPAADAHPRKQRNVPTINTVSNRADLISAGDALVTVTPPQGVEPAKLRVRLNGADVTDRFAVRPNGLFEGRLEDLRLGPNAVVARVRHGRAAKLEITNHPNGGPVFSGPQLQPWVCQSSAVDDQCNEPASYSYEYMPKSGTGLAAYDPDNPPADVATTTTDEGNAVPFIVRIETGYQDRDQYSTAILYDPAKPFAPWDPQKGWNHKLLITHGVSCGIDHQSGSAPSVTGDTVGVPGAGGATSSPTTALGRGFAVLSTALDNAGHNCNIVTEAESLVMAKERLVEEYGPIRYTIGTGCSGGSLTQQQVANAYPGIYQGILPQCSFPDSWSTGQQLVDYHLMRLYLENPTRWTPGVIWTPNEIAAVEGHPNHVNSIILDSLYWTALGDPTNPCAGVTAEQRYDPDTNPAGTRCTLADDEINILGPRTPEQWGPQEQALGHGFAGLPLDNVGVQYGLEALKTGSITPAQFVDLNAQVGGGTIDSVPTAARFSASEPALANSYRSGGVNTTNNLDRVAIIDLRGPDPGAFHDAYRSFAIRARLEREHGTFANQAIWYGQAPLIGDPSYTTKGLIAMDRWLGAVDEDKSDKPLAQKIIADRPSDIQDRCSQIDGVEAVQVPGLGTVCQTDLVETKFGTPRTVAGEPISTDQQKCQLQPLVRDSYAPVTFTDAQWAQLQQAFPGGVCDWSKPGVDQTGAIPWLTYQDAEGKVVYGGQPLGDPPRSKRLPRHRG
jgi:Tannase-like family of unknown function (DUF6351)